MQDETQEDQRWTIRQIEQFTPKAGNSNDNEAYKKGRSKIVCVNNQPTPTLKKITCTLRDPEIPWEPMRLKFKLMIYEDKSLEKARISRLISELATAYRTQLLSYFSLERLLPIFKLDPVYNTGLFPKTLNQLNPKLLNFPPAVWESTRFAFRLVNEFEIIPEVKIRRRIDTSSLLSNLCNKGLYHYSIQSTFLNGIIGYALLAAFVKKELLDQNIMDTMLNKFRIQRPYSTIDEIKTRIDTAGFREVLKAEKTRLEEALKDDYLNPNEILQITTEKEKLEKILQAETEKVTLEKMLQEDQLTDDETLKIEEKKKILEQILVEAKVNFEKAKINFQETFENAFDKAFQESLLAAKEAEAWLGGGGSLLNLGHFLKERGHFEEAFKAYEQIAKEDPTWEEANLCLFQLCGLKITMLMEPERKKLEGEKQKIEMRIVSKNLPSDHMDEWRYKVAWLNEKLKRITEEIEETRKKQDIFILRVPSSEKELVENWFNERTGGQFGEKSEVRKVFNQQEMMPSKEKIISELCEQLKKEKDQAKNLRQQLEEKDKNNQKLKELTESFKKQIDLLLEKGKEDSQVTSSSFFRAPVTSTAGYSKESMNNKIRRKSSPDGNSLLKGCYQQYS